MDALIGVLCSAMIELICAAFMFAVELAGAAANLAATCAGTACEAVVNEAKYSTGPAKVTPPGDGAGLPRFPG